MPKEKSRRVSQDRRRARVPRRRFGRRFCSPLSRAASEAAPLSQAPGDAAVHPWGHGSTGRLQKRLRLLRLPWRRQLHYPHFPTQEVTDADPPRLPEAEFERARGVVPRVQSHHGGARRKDDRGGPDFYHGLRQEVFAFATGPKESGNMKEGPMGRVQVPEGPATKRAALYLRTSTADQRH